jgi:hypothetical protein
VEAFPFGVSSGIPGTADWLRCLGDNDIAVDRFGKQGAAIFEWCGGAGNTGVALLSTDEAHSGRRVAAGAFAKGRLFVLGRGFEFEGGWEFGSVSRVGTGRRTFNIF